VGAAHDLVLRVRWSDVDPAGIVFYPRFYEWFDLATEALFESLGQPWPVMFPRERIVGVPIVESGARFSSPIRYGDEVTIRSTVAEVKAKTFRMEHAVSVGAVACAQGFEVRAWVAIPEAPGGRLAARQIPAEIARLLSAAAGPSGPPGAGRS
jgi:YbgC/YbaW family acyl-CoA thioester hydrolase